MNHHAQQQPGRGVFIPLPGFVLFLILSSNAEAAMRVWFEIQPQGSGVLITPFIEGADRDMLRYELQSETHSAAGNSQIRQAGGISPLPGQPTPITRLRMSPTQSGECEVTLRIFDGSTLLAEKKLTDCRPAI